jgi:glycosyltransferase involved in cell wall biosynthesis
MIDALVPARNEEATIGDLVRSLKESAEVLKVIVVDNGSSDDTASVAGNAGAFVIACKEEGKGQAVAAGLNFVRTARVLMCDGDLSPIPKVYVDRLARSYANERMVIGVPDFTPNVPWAKPGALWGMLSGVRSLPLRLLYGLREEGLLFGYTLEVMINDAIKQAGFPAEQFRLHGVKGQARYGAARSNAIDRDKAWLNARGYSARQVS